MFGCELVMLNRDRERHTPMYIRAQVYACSRGSDHSDIVYIAACCEDIRDCAHAGHSVVICMKGLLRQPTAQPANQHTDLST